MTPVMTAEDIRDATETFARYGVPEHRIFTEIMRARYLDYALFQSIENRQYGVSIEDLYENMKKTSDTLGLYEGDADTYVRAYTLALRVDPMAFAPDVTEKENSLSFLLKRICERAKEGGHTVLFSGAERYLFQTPHISDALADCRLAFTVKEGPWKKRLQLLFPRCRVMTEGELAEDTVTYDYIFQFAEEGNHSLARLLKDDGLMDVMISYPWLQSSEMEEDRKSWMVSGKLASYKDVAANGKEFALLQFSKEASPTVSFYNTLSSGIDFERVKLFDISYDDFQNAGEWEFDLFAFNAWPALQTLLSGHLLDMGHTIESAFSSIEEEEIEEDLPVLFAEDIREYGIYHDSADMEKSGNRGSVLHGGDLALSIYDGEIHMIPVPEGKTYVAGKGVFGFRGTISSWYLKLYLDGPVGRLFLETMKSGKGYAFTPTRFLRIPIPWADERIIAEGEKLCREAVEKLADAEENWRLAKRRSVGLMMDHSRE